jgi:hypothetical protein
MPAAPPDPCVQPTGYKDKSGKCQHPFNQPSKLLGAKRRRLPLFTRLACDIRQNCARRAIGFSRHGDRDGLITVSITM